MPPEGNPAQFDSVTQFYTGTAFLSPLVLYRVDGVPTVPENFELA